MIIKEESAADLPAITLLYIASKGFQSVTLRTCCGWLVKDKEIHQFYEFGR